jgi:G protein-coupled receptor GPR1
MDKQRKTIDYESTNKKRKWWSFSRYFEKEIMANEPVIINQKTEEALTSQDIINNLDINIQLQQANSQRLKTRYRVISRQMNLIFLYPTAYFFIWIFPVIGNSFRISYIQVYAISAIVAWVNPFNGVVDTLVFMIREKPWRYTYSKLARTQLDQVELVPCWRYWVRWLPLYRLPKELVEHYETVNHLREERSREPDFQFDTFADNISEFLSYPERSLNKDTKTSFQLSVVDNIESSCSTSDNTPNSLTKLQNNDTTNDKNNENDDDDSMDFLDFLNQGPPGV